MIAQVVVLSSLAALAAAQAAICSTTGTATIQSQADATALSSCTSFAGSILIGEEPSGTIALDGIQTIAGSLTATNATQLTGLTSTTITTIGKTFSLSSMTVLSNLQFDVLTEANAIDFEALPALSSLNFAEDINTCSSLKVVNTFLNSLDGINLMTAATIYISDNSRLTTFSTQIGNVTDSIDINNNGNSLVVEFPNLIWAANMTLRNLSSVSIPSLSTVNGSLGFYGNSFDSLVAPNLTTVGAFSTGSGGITIDDNESLQNISFPELTTVGGLFQIAGSDELSEIDFPLVSKIGGALDFTGNFTDTSLPKLTNVKGGFNMQSESNFDCSTYNKLKGNVIQGVYKCIPTTATTTTTTGGSSGSSSGSSSSSSSTSTKGAAASYGVSEGLLGLSVVGGLLQMLL